MCICCNVCICASGVCVCVYVCVCVHVWVHVCCLTHLLSSFLQVEMFLRRAFSATSSQMGKIHCLAFADSLDYDTGEKAEKDIKEFINTARKCNLLFYYFCRPPSSPPTPQEHVCLPFSTTKFSSGQGTISFVWWTQTTYWKNNEHNSD